MTSRRTLTLERRTIVSSLATLDFVSQGFEVLVTVPSSASVEGTPAFKDLLHGQFGTVYRVAYEKLAALKGEAFELKPVKPHAVRDLMRAIDDMSNCLYMVTTKFEIPQTQEEAAHKGKESEREAFNYMVMQLDGIQGALTRLADYLLTLHGPPA